LLGISAEQVLCLLLHLAIRYTPRTPIHIYLQRDFASLGATGRLVPKPRCC